MYEHRQRTCLSCFSQYSSSFNAHAECCLGLHSRWLGVPRHLPEHWAFHDVVRPTRNRPVGTGACWSVGSIRLGQNRTKIRGVHLFQRLWRVAKQMLPIPFGVRCCAFQWPYVHLAVVFVHNIIGKCWGGLGVVYSENVSYDVPGLLRPPFCFGFFQIKPSAHRVPWVFFWPLLPLAFLSRPSLCTVFACLSIFTDANDVPLVDVNIASGKVAHRRMGICRCLRDDNIRFKMLRRFLLRAWQMPQVNGARVQGCARALHCGDSERKCALSRHVAAWGHRHHECSTQHLLGRSLAIVLDLRTMAL